MSIALQIAKPERWASAAAERFQSVLCELPDAVIGLPTGRTPLPLYAELRRRAPSEPALWNYWRAVMLDDYLDASDQLMAATWRCPERQRVPRARKPSPTQRAKASVPAKGGEPPSSYRWLRRELLDPLQVSDDRVLRIPAESNGLVAACVRFERTLVAWGGCDLQCLGLGANGHIGFNEPGSLAASRTRAVRLTPETARANAAYWQNAFLPAQAVTMGIATILSAQRHCLLVTGNAKAEMLRRALLDPVGPAVPASFLQSAPRLLVIADTEAAALLPPEWRRRAEAVAW